MYKLAVFDLDGTLLNSNHQISNENLEAINLLRENNIRVVIATGRSNDLIKPYLKVLKISDEVITCNGAVIGHPSNDTMMYEDIIPANELRQVLEMCIKNEHQFLIYTSKAIVARLNDVNIFLKEKNIKTSDAFDANIIIVENIEDIINNYNVNKILIIERNEEKFAELNKEVQKFNNVEYTQSSNSFIDILPINNSKGKAVKILCEKFGYELEEVIVFGDQMNDISMMKVAGFSVAMANARDEVKENADFVTLSNNESGVAYAIKTKILK